MKLVKPLIYPKCHPDESPPSYLIRLAKLNHYGSYGWLIRDARISSIGLTQLYELLDQNPWTGFTRSHPFNDLDGLSYRYSQTTRIKVCPECIQEKGYWDYKTHAVLSPLCVLHQRWKVDFCTDCNKGYSWHLGTIQKCSCGAKRSSLPDEAPSKLSIDLASFIDDEKGDDIALKLDAAEFSYKTRCDLFFLFARHLNTNGKAGDFPRLTTVAETKGYWNKMAELLLGESDRLLEFIRSLNSHKPEVFKSFYRELQEFDQPSLSDHKEVVINFITRELKTAISKQHRSLYRDKPTDKIWLPLQTISRQFSIPKSTLHQLIDNGKVEHQAKMFEKRMQTLIFIDSPDEFQAMLNQYINFQQASVLLGVTKDQLKTLIDSGYLKDICKPEGHYLKWIISSDEIENLKENLHLHLKPNHDDKLKISEALSYYSAGFEDLLPKILKAILTQLITVTASTEERYVRDITLDKDEFLAWRNQQLKVSDKMSIVDLAERFGINQESMYQIVNAGLIEAEDNGKNRFNRLISEKEIQRFKTTYALLSKIAWALNKSPSYMKARIQMYRVQPIDETTDIDLRQTIYLRTDLAKCIELGYLLKHTGDWSFDTDRAKAA
jgi:hypothetical protein